MSVSISIGMSLWRLCGCERVSVLRHLATAAAVQLNNSLPINYTALYESRIPGHFVEVCSRPRHNLKTFLQILFFFSVRSDSYRFLFPKTSDQAQSSLRGFSMYVEINDVRFVSVDHDNVNSASSSKVIIHTVYNPFRAVRFFFF